MILLAYLIWNAKYSMWFGDSTDDVPNGLMKGDMVYFLDSQKYVRYNGSSFVDDKNISVMPAGANNVGDVIADVYDSNNHVLKTSATINVGDIEIGAVEIKDATTDTRAVVGVNGLNVDVKALPSLPAGNNNIGKIDVNSIAAGTNNIGKTGYTLKRVITSFTRPADTSQYAVGDAITNSTSSPTVFQLDLSGVGAVNGQSIEIRKFAVVSSVKQTTLPLLNAYLSPTTFTATNDNAILDIDDTTMEAGGSWIQLETQNYTASNSRVAKENANIPFILAANDTKIYGELQAANAYTPVSGEKLTVIAWVALL